jgi:hypothetical protein
MNDKDKIAGYVGHQLAKPIKASKMTSNSQEFFIDFRGENSEMGKVVVKAKDLTKFDSDIKERLEG